MARWNHKLRMSRQRPRHTAGDGERLREIGAEDEVRQAAEGEIKGMRGAVGTQ